MAFFLGSHSISRPAHNMHHAKQFHMISCGHGSTIERSLMWSDGYQEKLKHNLSSLCNSVFSSDDTPNI